jgi:nitrogen fixation protein NifU and related proteins
MVESKRYWYVQAVCDAAQRKCGRDCPILQSAVELRIQVENCRATWATIASVYSELVLDHFRNPRNAGKLPDATAEVQATNPVCGDILELSARVESGAIREVRFLCRGCTTSIASASFLTERLTGCMVAEAPAITAETISEALGGLPPATFHGAQLAADALSLLLAKLA